MTLQALRRCLLAAFLATGGQSAQAADWPGFRGPTGMGLAPDTNLPTTWGGKEHENILWQVPLPVTLAKGRADHNQASPIVSGGRIYVTTAHWPSTTADKASQEYPEQHVTCYQLSDGEQLWDTKISPGPWKLNDLRGGYAAPTPVSDGERVYVSFGSAVLAALDLKGEIVWRIELPDYQSFDVAISSSPLLFQGQLLLLSERNNQKATLTAYNPVNGQIIWEVKRPTVAFAHSTPTMVNIGGRPQMLVAASNALQGVDPSNGALLWWTKIQGDVCSPVYDGHVIFVDSGRGGPAVAVEPPADSATSGELPADRVKWKVSNIPEGLGSPVIVGKYLYRLHTPAVLKCFDIESGKELFARRLDGVSTASSPIATPNGLVYCASAGKSYIVRAGDKYDEVSVNELGENGSASPAVVDGKLIIKGNQHLFCVGKKPAGAP
jgi:outer membrane protein assembly factor BamB